jgi:translation initiation factor 2B subunit (eIF-2B alpha/beta/delta family)
MHPIERLRFVARASGADPATLVYEAANGMAAFVDDPVSLVTVCRRVIDRQPAVGPLWWLCARVLTEPDPRVAARRCLEEMAEDSTAEHTADALPDGATVVVVGWPNTVGDILARRGDMRALVVDTLGEGSGLVRGLRRVGVEAEDVRSAGLAAAVSDASLVILEASAIGPESALCVAGSHAAAAVASSLGIPVWLVGGVGRLLPTRMADSMRQRLEDRGAPWEADDEFVPLNVVTQICSVAGPEPVASALQRIDCPIAPELLRRTAF